MTHHLRAVVLFIIFLLFLASPSRVFAQVHSSKLIDGLKGKQLTSLVVIGCKGAPVGYSAPYPVNTFAYPDGQVLYRVELAMMRGEVGRMEKSFFSGSIFEVSSVDLKDDRLELKLTARDRDSGRLKLMLGSQWQSKMTDSAVFDALSHFLQLPAEDSSTVAVAGLVPSKESNVVTPGMRSTPRLSYQRSSIATDIPGRIPVTEVNQILRMFDSEVAASQEAVTRYSMSTSRGLRAFQAVYTSHRDFGAQRLANKISAEQAELGVQLVPRNNADVQALDALFKQCKYMAGLRQAKDNFGRELGPGGNNPDYVRAFLMQPDLGVRDQDVQQLMAALRRTKLLNSLQQEIVVTETSLDSGNFQQAAFAYSNLRFEATASSSVSMYLQKSAAIHADVDSLVRAEQLGSMQQSSILDLAGAISKLEDMESKASDRPLTLKYLSSMIADGKDRLNHLVSALPTFHYPGPRTSTPANHLTEAQAGVRATELSDSLNEAARLIAVVEDTDTMNRIHVWFGDSFYDALLKSAQGVQEAKTENAEMNTRIGSLRAAERQAEAERRAAAETRANAASDIVNTALIITKLDEQFRQTEVMGYSMEAQKQRVRFTTLIRMYRAPDVWAQVQARFQQILPGLTVWEANHAEVILAAAKP
jgi:hypothetical protein